MDIYNNNNTGDIHEEVDMDVGGDIGSQKQHDQHHSTALPIRNDNSKTEPINIDNTRRRASQRSFNDNEQVRTSTVGSFVEKYQAWTKQNKYI